jgi:hypothetical protein
MHRLAFARRPSATHVVIVYSSTCAACRASEDEVERFASGLMHELRFREGTMPGGDAGGGGGGSNGRLRVSSLDVTPQREARGTAGGNKGSSSSGGDRAAEVAGRLLGVEELPTAVVFVEGAPGCIRVGPRWRPDRPALTAERLLRVVNAARARALGGGEAAAGPPLEMIEGAHWPLGRDLLGLPPLWGEASAAALGGAALEEQLRRVADAGKGAGEQEEGEVAAAAAGAVARPSEASATATAAATAAGAARPQKRRQKQQQKQVQQQPRPTQLAAIAPSASASYWSRPGKARYWLVVAGAALLLWAWDAGGGQRRFERWQLARRTAARARGVSFSREVNEMDATDVLMDAIERAGAARARAGTTTAAAAAAASGRGDGGSFGRGRSGGGGASSGTPADALAAAEAEEKRNAADAAGGAPSMWTGETVSGAGGEPAAAIDVEATDVPDARRRRGRAPPRDVSARSFPRGTRRATTARNPQARHPPKADLCR